jgi:hypothetical protein
MHMAAQITRFGSSMGSQANDCFNVRIGGYARSFIVDGSHTKNRADRERAARHSHRWAD